MKIIKLLILPILVVIMAATLGRGSLKPAISNLDLPQLTELKLVPDGVYTNSDKYLELVFVFNPEAMVPEKVFEDLLELYRWGSPRLSPSGVMNIRLVLEVRGVPSWDDPDGGVVIFFKLVKIPLSKAWIDTILADPPQDLDQLITKLKGEVAKASGGAYGFILETQGVFLGAGK